MSKKLSSIRTKILVIISVVLTICFGFAAIGCDNDYTVNDAVSIARSRFGCKKILWVGSARGWYHNSLLDKDALPMEGGYYVIGVDKKGNEVYVVVPKFESDRYKATTFEWDFDYAFSDITAILGERGYKYMNGIDGQEEEYFYSHKPFVLIDMLDTNTSIKRRLGVFGDADELYEKLDVKLMFEYEYYSDDNERRGCFIVQEGGVLKLYEIKAGDYENFTVTEYNKDNIPNAQQK